MKSLFSRLYNRAKFDWIDGKRPAVRNNAADDRSYHSHNGFSIAKDIMPVAVNALKSILPRLLLLTHLLLPRADSFPLPNSLYIPNFKLPSEHFRIHARGKTMLDQKKRKVWESWSHDLSHKVHITYNTCSKQASRHESDTLLKLSIHIYTSMKAFTFLQTSWPTTSAPQSHIQIHC